MSLARSAESAAVALRLPGVAGRGWIAGKKALPGFVALCVLMRGPRRVNGEGLVSAVEKKKLRIQLQRFESTASSAPESKRSSRGRVAFSLIAKHPRPAPFGLRRCFGRREVLREGFGSWH